MRLSHHAPATFTHKSRIATTAAISLIATASAFAQTVQLNPKLRVGTVAYIEQVLEIEQKIGANALLGPERTVKSRHLRCMRYQIMSGLKRAETRLLLTYDRILIETETFGGPISFDSDAHTTDAEDRGATPPHANKPAVANAAAAIARPMLGKSITVHVGQDGRVRGLTGMDKILDAVEESAAGNFLFAPMMTEFTSAGARFTWADSRFAPYAYRPVSVGQTWRMTVHHVDVYLGALDYVYDCRLDRFFESKGRKIARVAYTGTIRRTPNSAPGTRLFNVLSKLKSGSFTGDADYDIDRGEFVKQSTQWTLLLDSSVTGSKVGEDITFAQEIKSIETFSLLSEEQRRKQRVPGATTSPDQTP